MSVTACLIFCVAAVTALIALIIAARLGLLNLRLGPKARDRNPQPTTSQAVKLP